MTDEPAPDMSESESADALHDYWTNGGCINPDATIEQLEALLAETLRIQRDRA